ncbi:hypothetical protein Gohar_004470 [Gossypium harknessii]|uniref:RNase H type-1 domain-containing protein n=1 Tax=Gossypium harknessii TaxID=34285 RepID=A0A7J9H4Y6_9ROSI|nr:hypothetical protein [Gossypium harknessii]
MQVERQRICVKHNDRCLVRGLELEDVNHVLRDCSAAKDVWAQIILAKRHIHFFSGNLRLGICFIFYAELWGSLDGLPLLQGKQCERVLIQIDSLEVVNAIQDPNS